MKSSEEMAKSVTDKLRTAQAKQAALKKRIAAFSATAAALALIAIAGFAVSGGIGMGAKSADSVNQNEENFAAEIPEEYDSENSLTKKSQSKNENAKAAEPNIAGEIIYLTYDELAEMLPNGNPIKSLAVNGFKAYECAAQFKNGRESDRMYSDCINILLSFSKGNASGSIFCRCDFNKSVSDYTESHPLKYPAPGEIKIDGTETFISKDESGYTAALKYENSLYEITVSGISSQDELTKLLSDFVN